MTQRIQDDRLRQELDGIIRNFREMSTPDLRSLMDCNDEAIDQQFTDCSAARQLERQRDAMLEKNVEIARQNLDEEQRFLDLRNTLLQMCHEAKQLKKSIEELETRAPSKSPNLDTVQAVLEAAARDAEEASDAIAQNFIENGLPADEFLSSFVDCRRNAHLRRIRAEKIVELIRENASRSVYPPSYPFSSLRIDAPPTPAYHSIPQMPPGPYMPPMPPYPGYGGPMSMPMPGM